MKRLPARFLIVAFLACANAPDAVAQYQAELSFDDGLAGTSGACNNMETDTQVRAELVDGAKRSALTEGRYGRAADFPSGKGTLELRNYSPSSRSNAFIAHLWVKARSRKGVLIRNDSAWGVRFAQDGRLTVTALDAAGQTASLPTQLSWPQDGEFHHLTIQITQTNTTPTFVLTIDYADSQTVSAKTPLPAPSQGTLRVGIGFDGLVDELIVANREAATMTADDDRFNRWPSDCPAGARCFEEVFTLTPRSFAHEVPVRFKTIYDPNLCSPASPCPLLIDISGGSACANDYSTVQTLSALIKERFVVVTIDPYCEGNGNTSVPDSEVGQFIAVKDFVMKSGQAKALISGSDYYASGCSHGAEAVLLWAINESDHPRRRLRLLCPRGRQDLRQAGQPRRHRSRRPSDTRRLRTHRRGHEDHAATCQVTRNRPLVGRKPRQSPVLHPRRQTDLHRRGQMGHDLRLAALSQRLAKKRTGRRKDRLLRRRP
jgi:hypothetical protein